MGLIHQTVKTIGIFLLLATLTASPWYYGSASDDALRWILRAEAAAAVCALLTLLTMPRMVRRQIALVRLAVLSLIWMAVSALACVQILPMGEKTTTKISPHIGELASELLPADGSEEARVEASFFEDSPQILTKAWPHTLSIRIDETQRILPFLLAGALAFLSTGVLLRTSQDRKAFWFLTMGNGVLLGLCVFFYRSGGDGGLLQKVWPYAGCPPYVNRNNAAGYIVLCLGPALGFLASGLCDAMAKTHRNRTLTYAGHTRFADSRWYAAVSETFFDFIDSLSKPILLRFLVVAVLITAAAVTLSRGGTLAALFAFFVSLVLVVRARHSGSLVLLIILPILLLAFGLTTLGGVKERISSRMATLDVSGSQETAIESDSRIIHWKTALKTIRAYRWRGSGAGTYEAANRLNDVSNATGIGFYHAENQLVETAMEMGAVGLVLKGIFFLILLIFIERTLRPDQPSDMLLFGISMAAILAGQAVAASFDFGLTITANSILFASFCGSFASLSSRSYDRVSSHHHRHSGVHRTSSPHHSSPRQNASPSGGHHHHRHHHHHRSGSRIPAPFSRAAAAGFFAATALLSLELIGLAAASIPADRVLAKALSADRVLTLTEGEKKLEDLDIRQTDAEIEALGYEISKTPEDPRLHRQLAVTWITRFRLSLLERFKKSMPDTTKEALWEQTAVEPLFYRMMTLNSGAEVTARCYRGDPVVRENLAPAMREILLARRLAPLDADTHLLYAVLFPLTADSPEMRDIVVRAANRAMMTAPYVAVVTFRAGALLFVTGNEEEACRLWRRSFEISPQNRRGIAKLLLQGEDTDTIGHRLEMVFPDDPNVIDQIYSEQKSSLSPQAADALLARLENILDHTADKASGEYLHAMARLNDYRGKNDESLALYDQALDIEPAHPTWLAEKADLCFRAKQFDEGIAALEQALQLDPGNQKFESLVERYRKEKAQYELDRPELRGIMETIKKNSGALHEYLRREQERGQ